jgi:chromosome segregation ATPase
MTSLETQIDDRRAELDSAMAVAAELRAEDDSLTRQIQGANPIQSVGDRVRRNAVREAILDADARVAELRDAVAKLEKERQRRELTARASELRKSYQKLVEELNFEGAEIARRLDDCRTRGIGKLGAISAEVRGMEEQLGQVPSFRRPFAFTPNASSGPSAFHRDSTLPGKPFVVSDG